MMLMDGPSFAIGGGFGTIIGFIAGFVLMAIVVTGKKADEMRKKADEEIDDGIIKCPFVYDPETCHKNCDWIKRCNYQGVKV